MDTIFVDEEKYIIMKIGEYIKLRTKFIDDGKEIERLSKKSRYVDVLSALKFYGFEDNYTPVRSELTEVERAAGIMKYDLSRVFSDNGNKARDAIASLEG